MAQEMVHEATSLSWKDTARGVQIRMYLIVLGVYLDGLLAEHDKLEKADKYDEAAEYRLKIIETEATIESLKDELERLEAKEERV